MNYLFVTTFPPTACGIASYASQHVARLREQGHVVDTLSPDAAGNVDYRFSLRGGWRVLRLLKFVWFYDRIVIQYVPSFYYKTLAVSADRWNTARTSFAFIVLFMFAGRKMEVVAHEVAYLPSAAPLNFYLYRWKWKCVSKLVLHTGREKEKLCQHYSLQFKPGQVELREHHRHFRKFVDCSQATARNNLGLSLSSRIFLCIGFIQRHKGFDRPIRAMRNVDSADAELYIVGSLRTEEPDNVTFLDELRTLLENCSRMHLVENFLTDQEFDQWIIASDYVVLPYREIWSSSVLARARLLGRRCIFSLVGGLGQQAGESDIPFDSDDELEEAFRYVLELKHSP